VHILQQINLKSAGYPKVPLAFSNLLKVHIFQKINSQYSSLTSSLRWNIHSLNMMACDPLKNSKTSKVVVSPSLQTWKFVRLSETLHKKKQTWPLFKTYKFKTNGR